MKNFLSLLMASILLITAFSFFPLSVGAREAGVAETAATSGTTGSCRWSFDSKTGVVTISGKGAMADYPDEDVIEIDDHTVYYPDDGWTPWKRSKVKKVVIESGVTKIGECAFFYVQ